MKLSNESALALTEANQHILIVTAKDSTTAIKTNLY